MGYFLLFKELQYMFGIKIEELFERTHLNLQKKQTNSVNKKQSIKSGRPVGRPKTNKISEESTSKQGKLDNDKSVKELKEDYRNDVDKNNENICENGSSQQIKHEDRENNKTLGILLCKILLVLIFHIFPLQL